MVTTVGEVQLENSSAKIGIERAHLEEDAGRARTEQMDSLICRPSTVKEGYTIDRIVSEADMRSPEEAYAYLTALERDHCTR